MYYNIRNYATESIAELRYMLKCAKQTRERLNHAEETEKSKELKELQDQEIYRLEEAIKNHWGRKLVRKGESAITGFDIDKIIHK